MEILAIQKPPRQPIGPKTNVKVCPNCSAVLSYNYEDMWVDEKMGNELNCITCPSCKHTIHVEKSRYRKEY